MQVTASQLLAGVLPYARAANAAYGTKQPFFLDGMSIVPLRVFNQDGLYAALYVINGRHVLAFRGSEPSFIRDPAGWFNDWVITNVPNALGLETAQYRTARLIVHQLKSDYSDLLLTGHSLGGGLAAYAGAFNSVPAVTFDPAGINVQPSYGVVPDTSMVLNFMVMGGGVSGGALGGVTVKLDQATAFAPPAPTVSTYTNSNNRPSSVVIPGASSSAAKAGLTVTSTGVSANGLPAGDGLTALEEKAYWHGLQRFTEAATDPLATFVDSSPSIMTIGH